MKGESSTLSSWMQPKPKHDDTQHSKSDDKTPTPTEVAESSQGSPTELVDSTAFDYYFEQNGARTGGNDDGSDDDFDGLATDEATAIAELMAQAAAKNVTIQVLVAVKRPREEPEPTEPTESEAELVKKHIGGEEG